MGPTSITALLQQLSLIGATIWGFIFWNTWDIEKAPLVLSGLALVIVSLVLSLYTGKKIEQKIGYTFKNKKLLEQAFTRSSYTEENGGENNEVLELWGDGIAKVVVEKELSKKYSRQRRTVT